MNQHQLTIVLIAVAAIAAIALVAFMVEQKRRSQRLRERFGPEYDRVVKQEGTVRRGEEVLQFRAAKREKLQIRTLSPSARTGFAERWRSTQAQFVDDPKSAVANADHLVNEVMQARGYPMGEFEQQASLISVDHPIVVNSYRSAHEIAERHNRGQASTEDLRQAMVYYRSLFDELLEEPIPQRKGA
jgi:uncharacterized membrane protein